MAAGIFPEPGTKYGPCLEACNHIDCAAAREDAARICHICQKAIGYGVRFYDISEQGQQRELVHARCHEDAIDAGGTRAPVVNNGGGGPEGRN